MTQKVFKIGSSAGITLSRRLLSTLGVRIGDRVDVQENKKTGTVLIQHMGGMTAEDIAVMKVGANVLRRYEKDFRALAKR